MTHLDDHLKEFLVLKAEDSFLHQSQVSTLRWLTLMTTWRNFLSWKLRTPFLITAKSLLWGDSCTLMTTWRSFLSWKLRTPFLQPSLYSEVTHLDDHLKEFLVLKVEDSLLTDWESLLGELHGKLPGGNKETWILVCDLLRLFCLLYTGNSAEFLARRAMEREQHVKMKQKLKKKQNSSSFERNIYTVKQCSGSRSRGSVVKWPPGSRSGSITLNYRTDPKILTFLSMTQRKLNQKRLTFQFFFVIFNTKCEKSNEYLPVWKHIFFTATNYPGTIQIRPAT